MYLKSLGAECLLRSKRINERFSMTIRDYARGISVFFEQKLRATCQRYQIIGRDNNNVGNEGIYPSSCCKLTINLETPFLVIQSNSKVLKHPKDSSDETRYTLYNCDWLSLKLTPSARWLSTLIRSRSYWEGRKTSGPASSLSRRGKYSRDATRRIISLDKVYGEI